jgi:hypothetical protein
MVAIGHWYQLGFNNGKLKHSPELLDTPSLETSDAYSSAGLSSRNSARSTGGFNADSYAATTSVQQREHRVANDDLFALASG